MKLSQRGVTLIEMLVVVAILGIMSAITYPSITAGLDSLRLTTACDDVANVVAAAQNFAERRQRTVEVRITPRSVEATAEGLNRRLSLDPALTIAGEPRSIFVDPAAPLPGIAVDIFTKRGSRRSLKIDPISGAAEIR